MLVAGDGLGFTPCVPSHVEQSFQQHLALQLHLIAQEATLKSATSAASSLWHLGKHTLFDLRDIRSSTDESSPVIGSLPDSCSKNDA